MKTIFIIVDTGTAIRNVLRSEVLEILRRQPGLRIVVFAPLDDPEFVREVGGENVIVHRAPKWKANGLVRLARSLRKDVWGEHADILSFRMRRDKNRDRSTRRRVIHWLNALFFGGDAERFLRVLEAIERFFTPSPGREYFDRYQPELVLFTTMYAQDPCLELTAAKLGIKTLCQIHSWDNPTTKGPFPIRPDRVLAWNDILRREVVEHHGIDPERVVITGVPQFDIYYQRERFASREEFMRRMGLDPDRKLITYTTGSTGLAPFEPELVAMLHRDLIERPFTHPVQLLVRLHPKDDWELYREVMDRPHMRIVRPGQLAAVPDQWNPTPEDILGLAELMLYSDVVINVASTITLDAAMFDRPVVNVGYDAERQEPFNRSCRRFYEYEHYKRLVATGGLRIAWSHEELLAHVSALLDDPTLEAEGRARIREQFAHYQDGGSCRRIADYLLHFLDEA